MLTIPCPLDDSSFAGAGNRPSVVPEEADTQDQLARKEAVRFGASLGGRSSRWTTAYSHLTPFASSPTGPAPAGHPGDLSVKLADWNETAGQQKMPRPLSLRGESY